MSRRDFLSDERKKCNDSKYVGKPVNRLSKRCNVPNQFLRRNAKTAAYHRRKTWIDLPMRYLPYKRELGVDSVSITHKDVYKKPTILIGVRLFAYPLRESNSQLTLRRRVLYPTELLGRV